MYIAYSLICSHEILDIDTCTEKYASLFIYIYIYTMNIYEYIYIWGQVNTIKGHGIFEGEWLYTTQPCVQWVNANKT